MTEPLHPLAISILHYQPRADEEDAVVAQVRHALEGLGHTVHQIAVDASVSEILRELRKRPFDLVFNLCETFADDYRMEVNVAALMEMGGVRYTGSGTAGLLLAQDKVLTKQLLEFHGIQTPNFASFENETFETRGTLRFPLIVKPARSDASIGIGKHSVVHQWPELSARVLQIRDELKDEALAEEFIEGREVYVGVIGPANKPEALPTIEMDFGDWDGSQPRVSDRNVKFDPETKGSPHLILSKLTPELEARIQQAAILAYRALKLRDYARIDFRISMTGEPYVLEANPNPYLDPKGELAMAAQAKGMDFPALIDRILRSAVARYRLEGRTPARPLM